MSLSVDERVTRVATFRFIEVRLMEIAAAWTPTTPEMEVKVMLGRHIWDFAQHADALGKRTFELRRPEQHSVPPVEPYVRLLDEVRAVSGTPARLAALYDAIVPGLEARYRRYLEQVDPLLDGPSIVIIERILVDIARQREDAGRLRRELALTAGDAGPLRARETAVAEVAAL
jgi:hypothetical protein